MKWLLIGDVHARQGDLAECTRLLAWCSNLVKKENIEAIWLTGDLFHYFNIVHNDVIAFWHKNLEFLTKHCKVVATVGNHDFEKGSISHSLQWLKDISNLTVVDSPMIIDDKLFVPYYSDNEEFVRVCSEYPQIDTLMGHQELLNAKYENGWYSTTGVDSLRIPQKRILMGHIHATQAWINERQNVLYVGSPRWLIRSDSNSEKNVWVTNFKDILNPISTKMVCSPILDFIDKEGKDNNIPTNFDCFEPRVTVTIEGSVDYIQKQKSKWEKLGFKVKGSLPKTYTVKARESEGMTQAFNKFIDGFKAPNGTSTDRIKEIVREKLSWI